MDRPTSELLQDKSLEGLRARLPPGLIRLERSPNDDACIVECWI